MEYQVWALDAAGKLLHCGPKKFRCVGPSVIRRWVAEWEAWADAVAKKWPGCPTADSRRKTAIVVVYAIGVVGSERVFNKFGRPGKLPE